MNVIDDRRVFLLDWADSRVCQSVLHPLFALDIE